MSIKLRGTYQSGKRLVRRLAHIIARPVKQDRGSGGVLIQPYRGYGSAEEFFLMGRVFRQPSLGFRWRVSFWRRDLLDVARRVFRRGIGDGVLVAQFGNLSANEIATTRVQTDRDGYFRVRLRPKKRPNPNRQWHEVDLRLVEPTKYVGNLGGNVQGQVFVPPATAQRVVISDIDDTVMFTGVVNKLKMMWRLFALGPKSRVAFPGVASLYRALHEGPSHDQLNPMLYVSRGPWSIYEILQEFFRLHQIPVGPILFLREWGLSIQRPLPPRAEDHKLDLIREMLKLYHDLPFVLIGDSGQHDPEIYAQVVREHPGRVEAVYIRNVSHSTARVRAIEELAAQVMAAGSTLMLASDSFAMARHAADHGFISSTALDEVLSEQQADEGDASASRMRQAEYSDEQQTEQSIERGELRDALETGRHREPPPNIAIESEKNR